MEDGPDSIGWCAVQYDQQVLHDFNHEGIVSWLRHADAVHDKDANSGT